MEAAVILTVNVVLRERGFVLAPLTVTTYDPGVVLARTARVMAEEPLVVRESGRKAGGGGDGITEGYGAGEVTDCKIDLISDRVSGYDRNG